jgi:hypothetical protein
MKKSFSRANLAAFYIYIFFPYPKHPRKQNVKLNKGVRVYICGEATCHPFSPNSGDTSITYFLSKQNTEQREVFYDCDEITCHPFPPNWGISSNMGCVGVYDTSA